MEHENSKRSLLSSDYQASFARSLKTKLVRYAGGPIFDGRNETLLLGKALNWG